MEIAVIIAIALAIGVALYSSRTDKQKDSDK